MDNHPRQKDPHRLLSGIFLGKLASLICIFKPLVFSLVLVALLSACSPLQAVALTTPVIPPKNPTLPAVPVVQLNAELALKTPKVATLATPTSTPPNTPIWSAYNYTCELAVGGGTMTMNLNWNDRSASETGYIVYRNQQAIATLEPNSMAYVDVVFVAPGKTVSYSVEAFNQVWRTSTSTITYGCQ